MMRTEDYKRELVSILFAQKHQIFWVTLVVFVGSILVANFWPPTYSGSGSILVSGKELSIPNLEALKSPEVKSLEITKEDLTSEVEILRSPEAISRSLEYLSGQYPRLRGPGGEVPHDAVYEVGKNLTTSIVPASNVIAVEFLDRDPGFAADLVNVLMEQYIVHRMSFFQPASSRLSPKFLGEQIDRHLEELRENEDRLIALVEASGVSAPQAEIESNIVLKKKLEEKLNELTIDFIETKTALEHLERALETRNLQHFAFVDSNIIKDLSSRLAELMAERGKALRTYMPETELVKSMDRQIDATYEALKAEIVALRDNTREDLEAIEEKMASLRDAIEEYNGRNVQFERQIVETERIRLEASLLRSSIKSLSDRKGEVEINDMLGTDDMAKKFVSILSRAIVPSEPAFPRPGVVIPLGLLVGLVTGVTLGLLREYFDHTFKKPSDVANHVDLPVLFSLAKPENNFMSFLYVAVILALLVAMLGFLFWKYAL